MLVLDSNVALRSCGAADGFAHFGSEDLIAPPVMWSEFRPSLHEALWRREVASEDARSTLERLGQSPIHERSHRRLGEEAWRIADELRWAKTYDAEYIALARLMRCRLVTLDGHLLRGARRLGFVIAPGEL
ncbi:MAG TPA: type II toxin-antitoxin system VapC family toxin [Actinomycetota bacterium]|nr:type II toxin-antitoxin system VapC family toxin [Actinomycetota bacterium]